MDGKKAGAMRESGRMTAVAFWIVAGAIAVLWPDAAHATDVTDVSQNIVDSAELLPGLVTGAAYILGLIFGVMGIIKAKEHVENPNKASIKDFVAPFLASGTLFGLPILYESMRNSIGNDTYNIQDSSLTAISGLIGDIVGVLPLQDFNQVLENIVSSFEGTPGLISAAAYALGLVMGVSAVLKFKQHIENPEQVELKQGVIRLLAGGALFALPTVIAAMIETVKGDGQNLGDMLTQLLGSVGLLFSLEAQEISCPADPFSLGGVACNLFFHTGVLPAFLAAFSYLAGVVLAVWAILKTKEHVLNPDKTTVWEGVSRFIAGGALMALPTIMNAAANSVALAVMPHTNTGLREFGNGLLGPLLGPGGGGMGLDGMMVSFMEDLLGPMNVLFTWFAIVAGMVLIIISIFRVMKSSQEGVRGPGGIGTLMTFLVGGALISLNPMIGALSMSLFNSPITFTYATLNYTTGMDPEEVAHAYAVISSVLAFMILVGWVSVIRGFFILRDVAEGGQQASMMAAVTHLIGGGLAINLGPLLNAVQTTLGIGEYGITFGI